MKSPFPGMDPYLEARWSDVHSTLVPLVKEALQPQLPPHLRARSEERIILEEVSGEAAKVYRSDVAVLDGKRAALRSAATSGGSALVAEPYIVQFYDGPAVDRFVRIIDTSNGDRVVTAIEVLSPWNKSPGRLNKDYRRKIDDYSVADVSVVEIDLLRGLRGRLKVKDVDLPPERRSPYLICVRRAWDGDRWSVYSVPLRERIPLVRVPLRRDDQDVLLDLQPLVDRVYAAGGHDDIDYSKPPDPPLDSEDEAWADELLRAAGRR